MAEDIIQVEDLSKMYQLGTTNTGTLSHDLNRWLHKIRGKEDPYLAVAETNNRATKSTSGFVWSLKDVSFSVKEGEVFGIIGKNGAGKSTLLKLLSKITKPTRGNIKIDGRIGSLLEVGTGFHPELSGRENIFLNGAILGMRRQEIKNKFDEIIDFSGVERYLDTPVKRYSSGMYVRLAFSIAAHLEPEILIIDEVLAVGDAEFQAKCLGKMQDVSRKDGRTVLFVSHNNAAVKRLCNRVMMLDKGTVKMIGDTDAVLEAYQASGNDPEEGTRQITAEQQHSRGYFTKWRLRTASDMETPYACYSRDNITIVFTFHCLATLPKSEFHIRIWYNDEDTLLHASSMDFGGKAITLDQGEYELELNMDLPVKHGKYRVEAGFYSEREWIDIWKTSTRLQVLNPHDHHFVRSFDGILNLRSGFEYNKVGLTAVAVTKHL